MIIIIKKKYYYKLCLLYLYRVYQTPMKLSPSLYPELEGSVFKDPTATKAALKFSKKVLQSGFPLRLFKKHLF